MEPPSNSGQLQTRRATSNILHMYQDERRQNVTRSNTNTPRDNVQHIETSRPYTLNIDKALKKKMDKCSTVKVSYKYTGGGIRGDMDTASFELFRAACSNYFSNLPQSEGTCILDVTDDKKKKAVVQQTYKIRRSAEDNYIIGYTINLYTTNNSILINGKDIEHFMTKHLPAIHQLMCEPVRSGALRDYMELNDILGYQLQQVLNERQLTRNNIQSPSHEDCNSSISSIDSLHLPNSSISNNSPTNEITKYKPKMTTHSTQHSKIKHTKSSAEKIVKHKAIKNPKATEHSKSTPEQSVKYKAKKSPAANPLPQSIRCLKCKKNCQTRSAICDKGNHWIHYKCDKLSSSEIAKMQSDDTCIYICKMCDEDQEQTKLKIPSSPASVCNENCDDITTLKVPVQENSPYCKKQLRLPEITLLPHLHINNTIALDILQEETSEAQLKCGVCDEEVQRNCNACDKCNLVCHQNCITDGEDNICHACTATDQQIKDKDNLLSEISKNINSKTDIKTRIITDNNNKRSNVQENTNMKQRELRQLEMKLKKWEEDLKIREQKNAETLKDHSRLEDYVNKTEARNHELEQTIRTLQRKIVVLESKPNTNESIQDKVYQTNIPTTAGVTPSDELILGVREQVTRFILKKVSNELTQLENISNGNILPTVQTQPEYGGRNLQTTTKSELNIHQNDEIQSKPINHHAQHAQAQSRVFNRSQPIPQQVEQPTTKMHSTPERTEVTTNYAGQPIYYNSMNMPPQPQFNEHRFLYQTMPHRILM